jgi:RNA polymerase sigma-70 factor (ECF subfamily)
MSFPTTEWDVVDVLKADDAERKDWALSQIVKVYAAPLLAFARAEFPGRQQQDYEDMLQGFLLKCWEKNALAAASPQKGRFRNLVVTVFKNHVFNADRDGRAGIRFPAGGFVSTEALLETYGEFMEPLTSETPEAVFERVYQQRIFDAAVEEFRERCEANDQSRRFQLFRARAVVPKKEGTVPPTHAELAERFAFPSANASVKLFRSARSEFRGILLNLLARGCSSAQESERECEILLATLLPD